MRIATVLGSVTLNRRHPTLDGASFKLVAPLGWDDLAGREAEPLEELVAFDCLGAGVGCRVSLSEGREAAVPFHPDIKPIDAYCAAILDNLEYDKP
jgi:microcompartment protein CcmK/EutM